MLKIYNGKFALLFLLKESSPAVLSSSRMWVHSINEDRDETHGEYVIIFIGIWHHIYRNMASYLSEYGIIYRNIASYLSEYGIIFIGIWHHIYWNMASYLFIVK